MKSFFIQTYGCQMNYSDSERIVTYMKSLGFSESEKLNKADIVIYNTCSIRQKGEDRVFGELKKIHTLKTNKKNIITVITGCMVRKTGTVKDIVRDKLFNTKYGLDIALRIEDLNKLGKYLREFTPVDSRTIKKFDNVEDYFGIDSSYSKGPTNQAYIPVSTGCDNFCSYCIVPYARGREKSRPIEQILEEAEKAVLQGKKEIVLIGQTVNSYGLSVNDKISGKFSELLLKGKKPFVHLLEELDKLSKKGLIRLRFTSPHPKDMSDDLIDAMSRLKTQMPWIHLPLQSGDDRVLKRMKRNYTTEEYGNIIQKLRDKIPGISITTDVIVGFCGETESEFEKSVEFLKEMNFEQCFISQYSERKGTYAWKNMEDDISESEKKKRWKRLNILFKKMALEAHKRFEKSTVRVLVEKKKKDLLWGRSEHYKNVVFLGNSDLIGEIVQVKILSAKEWILEGELLK